jgi:hypothetical protein
LEDRHRVILKVERDRSGVAPSVRLSVPYGTPQNQRNGQSLRTGPIDLRRRGVLGDTACGP